MFSKDIVRQETREVSKRDAHACNIKNNHVDESSHPGDCCVWAREHGNCVKENYCEIYVILLGRHSNEKKIKSYTFHFVLLFSLSAVSKMCTLFKDCNNVDIKVMAILIILV
jgi:hypothetical protein